MYDVATGQSFSGSSFASDLGMAAAESAQIQEPMLFKVLSNMPGFTASVGHTIRRGSNTILHGGFAEGRANVGMARGIRLNNISMRPRIMSRFHSTSIFDVNSSYSPFGFGASSLNSIASRMPESRIARIGASAGGMGDDAVMYSPGLLSFVAASAKLDRIGMKAGSQAFAGVAGDALSSRIQGAGTQKLFGYTRAAMGYGNSLGMTSNSIYGANVAARHFTAAAASAGIEGAALSSLSKTQMLQLAMKGGAQGRYLAGARFGATALPVASTLASASFAYSIGKMAGTAIIGGGMNLVKDAAKSLRGSINKPAFGMGYIDNEVAATSRARGVMAIQNSRLNARSILGSEAAAMSAHFG